MNHETSPTLLPVVLADEFAGLDPVLKFRKYRELWELAGRYEILTDYPLHLDLELAGTCNLRCVDCFQNGLIEGNLGLMEASLFRTIVSDGVAQGLCSIKLQVRGESFLNTDIIDHIKFAKKMGILDVQITTNGTLFTDKLIDDVLLSGLDALILSVDSHHLNSLNARDKRGRYESPDAAAKRLLDRRAELGLDRPWVRLRASVAESSSEALERIKADLKESFPLADLIIVGRIHDFRDDHDSFPDLAENYRLDPCAYLFHRLAVYFDGSVTVCCMDYNCRFGLGEAGRDGIGEIWRSAPLSELRRQHLAGNRKSLAICRHCHANAVCTNPDIMYDSSPRHIAEHQALQPIS